MNWLTPADIQARWPVSRSIIYALIRQGKLKHVRVGCNGPPGSGKILIEEQDWLSFLASSRPSEWRLDDEADNSSYHRHAR